MRSVILGSILMGVSLCLLLTRQTPAPSLPQGESHEQILVGANFAMSGKSARYGTWAANGVRLAVEEINAKSKQRLSVLFEDNKGRTADAISTYHKLKTLHGVRYVLTYLSSVALAVAPLANRDSVIQMDVSAATPLYSSLNDYTFRTGVSASQLASYAAKIMYERFGITSLAVFSIESDFGDGMMRVFCESYPGNISLIESFPEQGRDFRLQLLKLKRSGLQHVWFVGQLYESALLIKQAREIGITSHFYTDLYSVEGPEFLSVAGKAAEDVVYFSVDFQPNRGPQEARTFSREYQERFQEQPTYLAAQAYDGLKALASAIDGCPPENTDCVRQNLSLIELDGASGRIAFDEYGDVTKDLVVKKIENGRFVRKSFN